MEERDRYRSFFWPIILIGVGVIWLLVNLNLIPASGLVVLLRLWPLLLIGIGLDLLFGRRLPLISALIGLGLVGLAIVLVVAAPTLGFANEPQVRTERFVEPLGQAASVRVMLDLWSDPANVSALSDSQSLFEAEITHAGQVNFTASGEQEKTIRLSHDGAFGWFFFDIGGQRRADIRLSPQVPLELSVDVGSGSVDLDLQELQLSDLNIDGGSGSADVVLPASAEPYQAEIQTGSGSFSVEIAEGAQLELRLDTGSGSVSVDVPDAAALQVEVRDSGSGSVSLPSGLVQVESGDDDEGVWETQDFAGAAERIVILVEDLGSGSFTVR